MNYKVNIEFDAFDCDSPEDAALQIEALVAGCFKVNNRLVYTVTTVDDVVVNEIDLSAPEFNTKKKE